MSQDFSKHSSLFGRLDSAQIQIILLKLIHLFDNVPNITGLAIDANIQQRKWLSAASALLKKYDNFGLGIKCETAMSWGSNGVAIRTVHGYVSDAIEAIKLDLELDGRSEIGTVYEAGQQYRYFKDLKNIIANSSQDIFLIDPYFDGATFEAYLSEPPENVSIRILAGTYSKDIHEYVKKHSAEFKTQIDIRKSSELHDRLVIIDQDACWISGQSIKDAGSKTTYLIPLTLPIAQKKYEVYAKLWENACLIQPSSSK